jgi:hypothetical protein
MISGITLAQKILAGTLQAKELQGSDNPVTNHFGAPRIVDFGEISDVQKDRFLLPILCKL